MKKEGMALALLLLSGCASPDFRVAYIEGHSHDVIWCLRSALEGKGYHAGMAREDSPQIARHMPLTKNGRDAGSITIDNQPVGSIGHQVSTNNLPDWAVEDVAQAMAQCHDQLAR